MACVELPKDAEGRDIPLDTKRLYDANGVQVSIRAFRYNPNECFWRVESLDGCGTSNTTELRLTQPESWEKLEEDLDKAASKTYCGTCTYFGKNPTDCDTCSIGDISACDSAAMRDIASRIRKLRGED